MLVRFLFVLFYIVTLPSFLVAGSVALQTSYNDGMASYTVHSADTQNLKSTLKFPHTFYAAGLAYTQDFGYASATFSFATLAASKKTTGEDFDWKDNNLTVYSHSLNKQKRFNNLRIDIRKDILKYIALSAAFEYTNMQTQWYDTFQSDYVKNNTVQLYGETLRYDQTLYKYAISIGYKNRFGKLTFLATPSIIYAFIETKDHHILRHFYATQNIQTFGYNFNLKVGYPLTKRWSLFAAYRYEKITEKNVDMRYFTDLGQFYTSYPSSYTYKNNEIKVACTYNF